MRILITGGAGFIGSHIAGHFRNEEVIVIDDLRTGSRKNLENTAARMVKGSVTDLSLLKKWTRGASYVFHLAALVSVPESIQKPRLCEEINALGALNVLEAARENRVQKVILASSAAVYGTDPALPKKEEMTGLPQSAYSITKLSSEYYGLMYQREFGLPVAVLRYFNVFGPGQDPSSPYAAAIPAFIQRALKNEDVVIHGDGEQTRDFIFVKDVVSANLLAAGKGSGVYNVGRGERTSILDLAKKIIALTGSSSRIVFDKERPGDIRHSCADITRLKNLGFRPETGLDQGLALTIPAFR